MRTTEAIDDYDLAALGDSFEHLGSRVGDRLIEQLVQNLSPTADPRLSALESQSDNWWVYRPGALAGASELLRSDAAVNDTHIRRNSRGNGLSARG
jgi:hypothetical protein